MESNPAAGLVGAKPVAYGIKGEGGGEGRGRLCEVGCGAWEPPMSPL